MSDCTCEPYWQDAGGGYTELLADPDPDCPEHFPKGHPCPHGCKHHTVRSLDPTACGHYHSPDEWGHREQVHNSEYWKAIGENVKNLHNQECAL